MKKAIGLIVFALGLVIGISGYARGENRLIPPIGTTQPAADERYANVAGENQYAGTQDFGGATTKGMVPLSTVDQGFAYLPTVGMPSSSVLQQQLFTKGNQVKATQFVLPFQLKVSDIQVYVTSGVGGGCVGCGIYSADKGTLLLETGSIAATGGSGRKAATLDPTVTLEAGVYWYAWTTNSEDVKLAAMNNSTYVNTLFYDTNPQMGAAANGSSGCTFPATLGAITFEATMKIPIALMKP